MLTKLHIYTDGSCSGNPGPGGWAAIIILNDNELIISGFETNTTNNRMEILAAINALKEVENDCEINLFTDSNYLKNGITLWISSWKNNNWRNSQRKPVANQDLWKELDEINEKLNVKWSWIKAHNESYYNNLADKYAVTSMKEQKNFRLKNGKIIKN